MKKRLFLMLSIIITVISCSAQTLAIEPLVQDGAGLLTDEEKNALEIRLEHLTSEYDFTVALVTESVMSGEDEQTTAGEVYDYNNYGMGDRKDGILLYISMNPRKYYLLTNGAGTNLFTDNGIIHMEDAFLDYLKADEYNSAFTAYADSAEEILNYDVEEGMPYDALPEGTIFFVTLISLAISLIVAAICTAIRKRKMKTVGYQAGASNYVKPGSMHMDFSRDVFLYSNITKSKKPEPEHKHSSSDSGSSRGGHGGSF